MITRKFKLINASGQEWNLMQRNAYFSDPEGLGLGFDTEYMRIGQIYEQIQSASAQKTVSGNMLFKTYADYRAFADFVSDDPLRLAYMPQNEWYYLDCFVTGMSKGEKGRNHWLTCPITFTATSMWYIPKRAERTADDIKYPKKYTYSYKVYTEEETRTASGNPLTITDAIASVARDLDVSIEPIQDLHGYSKPWVGGVGKNLLPMTVDSIKSVNNGGIWSGNEYTYYGVTYTLLTDSGNNVIGINANGTARGNHNFYLITQVSWVVNESVILSGVSNGSSSTYRLRCNETYADYGNGVTIPADTTITRIDIRTNGETVVDNVKIYPMIRLASESDATFAPYTNICPISGSTEVTITREGIESADTETVTIQLGQTVYGGTLDVLTGVLTVNKGFITYDGSADEAWEFISPSAYRIARGVVPANAKGNISNMYIVDDTNITTIGHAYVGSLNILFYTANASAENLSAWKANLATNPLELCYTLATPTTVQLTPAQLELLEVYNYIFTDADLLDLNYTALVPTGEVGYKYADELNGVIRINNQSSEESPCIISIAGPITNPSWYLTVNNEQEASGSVEATIPDGHKLVVNSIDGKLEIAEYISGTNEYVRNLYQAQDWTRENFITVPPGGSVITISGETAGSISAWVEVREVHETV
jgi:hypothetical protein